jgi:hypothetical protein
VKDATKNDMAEETEEQRLGKIVLSQISARKYPNRSSTNLVFKMKPVLQSPSCFNGSPSLWVVSCLIYFVRGLIQPGPNFVEPFICDWIVANGGIFAKVVKEEGILAYSLNGLGHF